MSIEIDESVQKRIETVTSEQFDAFERQDREIRIEERRERAMQLGLPTVLADKRVGIPPPGPIVEAIDELRRGLEGKRATGADVKLPYYFGLLAEAHGRIGQISEGLTPLSEALEVIERTDEHWFEAELYRLRGEALQAKGDSESAELWFSRSLAKAQAQNAKLWELRTCRSIARLRRDQGKPQQAHDLLAAVYGRFTEGFDTPDLREAKALLDGLAS
jgi:predicted ATPase